MYTCRDAPFDPSVSWDTPNPDVSLCAADWWAAFVPAVLLMVLQCASRLYAPRSRLEDPRNATRGQHFWAHTAANGFVALVSGVDFAVRWFKYDGYLVYGDIFQLCVAIACCLIIQLELVNQVRERRSNSPTLFIFWLLDAVLHQAPLVKKEIDDIQSAHDDVASLVWVSPRATLLALTLFQLVLSCFSWQRSEARVEGSGDDIESPEYTASFFSGIYYCWVDAMIWRGLKAPLTLEAVPKASRACDVKARSEEFSLAWDDAARAKGVDFRRRRSRRDEQGAQEVEDEVFGQADAADTVRIVAPGGDATAAAAEEGSKKRRVSLWWLLLSQHWRRLFFGSLLNVVFIASSLASPSLVKLIINHVSDPTEEAWKGYFYAVALFLLTAVGSLFNHGFLRQMVIVSLQMNCRLTSLVYRKSLRLSSAARRKFTSGQITNLMSVDADKALMLPYFTNIWSAPLEISLALYLLYQELGAVAFLGLLVMLLVVPINAWGTKKEEEMSRELMEIKDSRIKFMNEFLAGIKVVKLYAWELPLMKRINSIRSGEIRLFRTMAWLWGLTSFTFEATPFLISLTVFGLYTLVNPLNPLTAEKIFVSVALMNILRMPMVTLPWAAVSAVKAAVGINRIQRFLNCSEVDKEVIGDQVQDTDNAVEIRGASFEWDEEDGDDASAPASQDQPDREGREGAAGGDGGGEEGGSRSRGDFSLKDIDLEVKKGSLVAVVGRVGSGKSTLLSSILGEAALTSGAISVASGTKVAYVPQQAWILNVTLKNNILFGSDLDDNRYESTLDSCSLRSDLSMLAAGDKTEIGENGINLSGGQKQRVSLARAVYNDADLYLLDDPLSAVDAHVGAHIFEHVIADTGMLAGKTRVFVTNDVKHLRRVDSIIVLRDGRVAERGPYAQLMENDGAFAEFVRTYDETKERKKSEADSEMLLSQRSASDIKEARKRDKMMQRKKKSFARQISESHTAAAARSFGRSLSMSPTAKLLGSSFDAAFVAGHYFHHDHNDDFDDGKKGNMEVVEEGKPDGDGDGPAADNGDEEVLIPNGGGGGGGDEVGDSAGALVEEEGAEVGKVSWRVYWHYIRKIGVFVSIYVFFMHLLSQFVLTGSSLWMAKWADSHDAPNSTTDDSLYLGVYGGMCGFFILVEIARDLALFLCAAAASDAIHRELLSGISRAPMAFFDTNPTGRIVNRFSGDLEKVDGILPWEVSSFASCLASMLSIAVTISYTLPVFLAVIAPTAVVYLVVQRCYISTSRQLQRISSVVRSPVYSHFTESLSGVPSIRAYGVAETFIQDSIKKVNAFIKIYYAKVIVNRWLATRIELLSAIIVLFASAFAVSSRGTITAGLAGLAVTYALNVTGSLTWLIRMMNELETNSVSLERILEYSRETGDDAPSSDQGGKDKIPRREAEWYTDADRQLADDWPEQGEVQFDGYSTRYRPGLDLVLKGLDLRIAAGEKIGVCGRTGAGKSSLAQALLRLLEPAEGRVSVDGVDTAALGLQRLRGALTTIPQDPVLFTGPLRFNLDPEGKRSDAELWDALRHASLADVVGGFDDGLEHEVSEGGENFSQGQRQLICLARALLRKTKVLILDEATAAVDLETDDLIQQAIRREFKDCTVITIAHRLNTILDSDRVAVLSAGRLLEFAPPSDLLQDTNSAFYGLAKDAKIV